MNFKEYLARPEISASDLKKMAKSMKHWKYCKDNPKEETDSMRLGSAIHCSILEPERFLSDYVCAPICDKRTKEGKLLWESFVENSKEKIVLKNDEYNQVLGIQKSVLSSPKISHLLKSGESEKTIFYEFEGVKMKSRLDFANGRTIIDIKSSKSALPSSFARDAYNMDYDMQLFLYAFGYEQNFGVKPIVIILATEKDDEMDYCPYYIDDEWMESGMKKAKERIAKYKKSVDTGIYEGLPKDIQNLPFPKFARAGE